MSGNVANILNIVGASLILGLVLRYSTQASQFITASGTQANVLLRTLSLQD